LKEEILLRKKSTKEVNKFKLLKTSSFWKSTKFRLRMDSNLMSIFERSTGQNVQFIWKGSKMLEEAHLWIFSTIPLPLMLKDLQKFFFSSEEFFIKTICSKISQNNFWRVFNFQIFNLSSSNQKAFYAYCTLLYFSTMIKFDNQNFWQSLQNFAEN